MIHVRQLTSSLAIRAEGDGRTLIGPLLPWQVPARVVDQGRLVTETFTRGALAGTDPARVPLTATHPRDAGTLPIGVTLSIDDRADAAWGEWHVSDTMIGNEVLALARDGVPLACRSASWRWQAGAAGAPTASESPGPGPPSTTSPWSGNRPTKGPASWAFARVRHAPRRSCSPCSVAMGKHTPPNQLMGHEQGRCRGCRRHFVGPGERCQACQQRLRQRKRRKRR